MDNAKKRVGIQTVKMKNPPKIISTYSIVGPKEGEGPLGQYFHEVVTDDTLGKDSYEKAESELFYQTVSKAIENANLKEEDINYIFAGDLLNQLTSTCFAARDINIPFFGLFGACSTMTESLSLASMLIDGDFAEYTVAATVSHFSSSERQFRFPLEYGSVRYPTSQWTVTGSGAMVLGKEGNFPEITYVTTGLVKDYGIKDSNNMGAAMAPAAVDTIVKHLQDTGRGEKYYDAIVTGDLGRVGKEITLQLLEKQGYNIRDIYYDCGDLIFDDEKQGTNSGGSGCGCSASVACSYFYGKLINKEINKLLLVSTGALMSPTSTQQGESIPGIAHAVAIEFNNNGGEK